MNSRTQATNWRRRSSKPSNLKPAVNSKYLGSQHLKPITSNLRSTFSQICEKEREALNRIEIARGEIAMQWEDRLLHEMNRLRVEMEQTNLEDRLSAINRFKREALQETEELTLKFNMREKQLTEEVRNCKG